MIALLVLALTGLASWPLWPPPWRLGLALGWSAVLAVEILLLARRRRAMRSPAGARGYRQLQFAQVLGFLLKLFLVTAGGILGAATDWYHEASFLLAFVAGLLAGEAVSVTALLRGSRGAGLPPQ